MVRLLYMKLPDFKKTRGTHGRESSPWLAADIYLSTNVPEIPGTFKYCNYPIIKGKISCEFNYCGGNREYNPSRLT
jgi:hypothetical protein